MGIESHGTHVASIAAGNRGVCRNAAIAGVLIDLPDEIAGPGGWLVDTSPEVRAELKQRVAGLKPYTPLCLSLIAETSAEKATGSPRPRL